MSEKILKQILEKLQSIEDEQRAMRSELNSMQNEQRSMSEELRSIKADTSDIPLIRRAVLETAETLRNFEKSKEAFERKTASELNTHEYNIDILNREQLKLKTEIEKLKNR